MKFDTIISRSTLSEVILKLVELVDKKIAAELQETKGSVIYDGLTQNRLHYVALIASFCIKVPVILNGTSAQEDKPRLVLLSFAPLGAIENETDLAPSLNA